MKEIDNEAQREPVVTPTETPAEPEHNEAPVPEESAKPEPEEKEHTDEPEEASPPEESPKEEEKPKEDEPADTQPPKPKKDLSGLTKEEKAEFAFQRQLAKQKSKYEQSIEDIKKTFQAQFDEIKQTLKPKAEKKSRSDFESDDEYIAHLTKEGVSEALAERDAKDAEKAAKAEQEAKEAKELQERQDRLAETFNANCRQCFADEAQYKDFSAKVQRGLDNGLAELLDDNPVVREYLFTNPNGPFVLKEMLDKKEAFVRVMSRAYNPIEATITMHEMARELASRPAEQPAQQAQQPARMPNIGKPGASRGGGAPSVFDSDASLIRFVRDHR
jgi:hypothetical protein